jgi:hypothetical protein
VKDECHWHSSFAFLYVKGLEPIGWSVNETVRWAVE